MNLDLVIANLFADLNMAIFSILLISLTIVDFLTFFTKRHVDTKGVLTSLGLLGTFIGIFNGLVGFNTQNISASVPILLEGLKFAFLTSVVGMILAVILHVVQTAFKLLGHGSKVQFMPDLTKMILALQDFI